MRKDAIQLEETRLQGVNDIKDYPSFHERHRIFPSVFENREHKRILDVAAGVGVVGKRIQDNYRAELVCNDISPVCLKIMQRSGISTTSFDIDDNEHAFPFPDNHFDAVIALATIEHVIHIDHFLEEINRILTSDGYLYISAPNYLGLLYLIPFLISGKTFHDPMSEASRYEFYAHVRYFTYRTLLELVSSYGFIADTVYLAIPENGSRYQALKAKSKTRAFAFRFIMKSMYKWLSPRWASEPVICFRKADGKIDSRIREVIL